MKQNLQIKFFLLLALAMVGTCNVWGNQINISGSGFNGKVSSSTINLGGNHVAFSFTGSGMEYSSTLKKVYLGDIRKDKSKSYTITWNLNEKCNISISKIRIKGSCSVKGNFSISNGTNASNASSFDINTTSISSSSVTFSCTGKAGWSTTPNYFYITDIIIDYTITPNAPTITNTTASIDVTVDTNNKKTVDYASRFSVPDNDFTKTYSKSGGVFEGNNFYATTAGTYTITSSISAKDNCHAASSASSPLTVTVNRLNPTLTYNNANLDISISDADKTTIDLNSLKTAYTGNGTISYSIKSGSGAHLSGSTLYATSTGTIVVTATASQTGQYNNISKDITITVQKRTPVVSWKSYDHIYAGDILTDVASTSYNSKSVSLTKTYAINSGAITIDTQDNSKLHVSSTITAQQNAEVKVTTTETSYYKSVVATHSYTLEPKATPKFYLNGTELPTNATTNLNLEIGQTANVSFELTDESTFEYPQTTAANYFSYVHNASAHTGVITATKYGDEAFSFHQKGTTTIFDHTCNLHIYVSKHVSTLTTPLTDGTWKVDDLYTGQVYSSNDSHPVVLATSDEQVLKVTNEGIKAVGAGSATLYIRQAATNEWTGDTISVNITVEKYTPVVTWNIDANLPWGSIVNDPVVSTNTELPYTVTSGTPSRANYVNGQIEVYNNTGNVTFTFAQEGNYKWNAVNVQKTISVYQPANHVPATLSQSNYKDFVCANNKEYSWDGGIRVASPAAKYAFDWDDRYVILHFEGIPSELSFSCSNSTASSYTDFYVCEGASQSSLTQIWSASSATSNVKLSLQPNTRYIKLCFSGNYAGYFKNISITERKEVVAPETCTFDPANVGAEASKKEISVDWYNVQTCTLTISGTDADLFTVNKASIASSLDNYGTETIDVSYAHTRGGSHAASLTIQSADGQSATVALSGTSNKITPTISWVEGLSPMEKGASKANPAIAAGLTFSYSSSDPSVIEIVDGNTLHALKKGSAEITASFDGTEDVMWNSAQSKITVAVTDIKVLRIDWPQSFTNLKTGKPDVALNATVYYYNLEDSTTILIDRPITFTSQNTNYVTIVDNNKVHIVGVGETTITATVAGEEGEFIGTSVVRKVKVREPSAGCDIYVLEDASASLFTEVSSFSGVEKVLDLSGEPASITFDAWSEKWYAVSPSGNLKLAEYYDGSYHTIWDQTLNVGTETSYGPLTLNRKTTKIKFFKEVGSTCYHNFASAYVTLAKYLELDNTVGKTTTSVDFPESETNTGVTYTKYVTVNFSNISDVLDIDLKQGTHFSVLKQDLSGKIETIGEDCGDKGKTTIAIQFLSNEVKNYKDTIVISNKDQSVTIYLSAEVARHNQQITWNPTTDLLTTDNVTFSATTTATDLNVTFALKEASDVASVTTDGQLTIYKAGQVTIVASQAGSETYKPATDVEKTFTISRVTPTITTLPTAAEVILPQTLAGCALIGGEASVAGTFAWTNNTTAIERGNAGYEVTFTPDNLNYYNTTTCNVIVPVAKDPQTITWDFTKTEMFCNADITFDATATSGLKVKYATSDASVAYVDDANHLNIIKGGEVTITAQQEGNETWAAATNVAKTLTIHRFTPTIVEVPVAGSMLIGQLLSNAVLDGGRAELNDVYVAGTYAWENGNTTTIDVAGKATRTVIFSPQNSNYYNSTTCEVEVEVKKYAPTMTNNLHASTITYGQALSASSFSGTLVAMDNVKYPAVEVAGTYAWKEQSLKLNAGNRKALVTFTPENTDWYEAVDVEVPIIVNKATASTATATSKILYGQILGEAVPVNTTVDLVDGIIEGKVKWNVDDATLQTYPTTGNHEYDITLEITDPNYINTTIFGKGTLTVEPGFAFDGHNGTTSWSDPQNWKDDAKPSTLEDKVIVMADAVIINTEVNVGALTIKNDVNVTIQDGGTLNVGNYDCVLRTQYGNVTVEKGGQFNLSNGKVTINNLFIQSSLGGTDSSTKAHKAAKSGQIDNADNLHINGAAYFDLALDANGECTPGWYDFTVPFPVNASTGVQRFENGVLNTNLKCEKNYAIMTYHEDVRAQGKYGWAKYHGVMQPGQCYSITIDDYHNVYRFVKTKDGALNTSTEVTLTATEGEGGAENKGWNCIGNGTCNYANIEAAGISKVQIYDHTTNSYSPVDIDGKTFVVGSAIFVQAPENESMLFNKAETEGTLYAPRREARATEEFAVTLSHTNSEHVADRLYLSASEDAIDTYEIGHDLAKFGVSTTAAQMWCSAYDMRLCDVELPLNGDNATFPIVISAPKAGTYTLNMVQGNADARLYLLHNGNIIADLSLSDYTLNLNKGTNSEYALQLVAERRITTDTDDLSSEQQVEKVIINDQLYIFREGKIYDATGKCVK